MEVGVQYAVSDVLLFCLFVTEMSFNIVTNHELLALEKGCLSAKSQELATEKCTVVVALETKIPVPTEDSVALCWRITSQGVQ